MKDPRSGRTVFVNHYTRTTTWDDPRRRRSAPPAPALAPRQQAPVARAHYSAPYPPAAPRPAQQYAPAPAHRSAPAYAYHQAPAPPQRPLHSPWARPSVPTHPVRATHPAPAPARAVTAPVVPVLPRRTFITPARKPPVQPPNYHRPLAIMPPPAGKQDPDLDLLYALQQDALRVITSILQAQNCKCPFSHLAQSPLLAWGTQYEPLLGDLPAFLLQHPKHVVLRGDELKMCVSPPNVVPTDDFIPAPEMAVLVQGVLTQHSVRSMADLTEDVFTQLMEHRGEDFRIPKRLPRPLNAALTAIACDSANAPAFVEAVTMGLDWMGTLPPGPLAFLNYRLPAVIDLAKEAATPAGVDVFRFIYSVLTMILFVRVQLAATVADKNGAPPSNPPQRKRPVADPTEKPPAKVAKGLTGQPQPMRERDLLFADESHAITVSP